MNTLADLAIKKVAECITDGTYDNLDYQLIPYHCDKVVSEILKSGNGWKNRVIRHLMDRNFMLSNLDFEDFRLDETCLEFLRNQKLLRFLVLGDLESLENGEEGENESFDVIKFLEESLHPKCRKILLKLNISGTKQFSNGWMENLSRMFPWLLEFSISGRQILGNSGNLFFKFFPNLIRLDLGGTNIKKLDGIKKLKNLEWLSLKDLDFESSEDIQEIFELKNLKFLDLSATRRNPDQRIIEKYLECQKNLDSLEIFECSGTDLDRFSLQSLELTHGNLKIVIAMETSIGTSTIPDSRLQILNSGTFENQIKTLDYYFESKNRTGICWCLHYLKEMLKEGDVENIPECFQKILEALKRFGRFNDVKKFGIECLIEFKEKCALLNKRQIRNFAEILLEYTPETSQNGYWEALEVVLNYISIEIDASAVCKKAVTYLSETKEEDISSQPILRIVAKFMPKMSEKVPHCSLKFTLRLLRLLQKGNIQVLEILEFMAFENPLVRRYLKQFNAIPLIFSCMMVVGSSDLEAKCMNLLNLLNQC